MTREDVPWPPTELRFPAPPAPLIPAADGPSSNTEAAATYVTEILAWRNRLMAALSETRLAIPERRGFTTRARRSLTRLLGEQWDPEFQAWTEGSPYNLSSLAARIAAAEGEHPTAIVLELLRWRAGIHDYLDDIWDVAGEPSLSMWECGAMLAFLVPIGSSNRCSFCLAEFEPARIRPDHHACVVLQHVRAKWPTQRMEDLRKRIRDT